MKAVAGDRHSKDAPRRLPSAAADGGRRRSVFCRLFFAACLGISCLGRAADTFYKGSSADHVIMSEGTATGSQPAVAVDYLQNTHVVWKQGRDVFYAKSDPDGNWLLKDGDDWVAHKPIFTNITTIFTPSIAVDYDGFAHVAVPGGPAIKYMKLDGEGNIATKALVYWKVVYGTNEFKGADIAIDPTTNLPVIGTLGIYGYDSGIKDRTFSTFYKYKERILVAKLDAAGKATWLPPFELTGFSLGGPMGAFEPPAICVGNDGVVHAVWKAYEGNEVDPPPKDKTDPNLDLAKSYGKTLFGIGWWKNARMLHYSNSVKAADIKLSDLVNPDKIKKGLPVRVNYPDDVDSGTYVPVPRIAVDKKNKIHIAWTGTGANKRRCVLYSRVNPAGKRGGVDGYGDVEVRSAEINGPLSEVEKANCDLAVGETAIHLVWADGRNSVAGNQIFQGRLPIDSGFPQRGGEVAVSAVRDNHAINPRIAFRPEKEFLKWEGYAGDTGNPSGDPFVATEPNTAVRVYDTPIQVTATFKPWPVTVPSPKPCPPDPPIDLPALGTLAVPEVIPIAADYGKGNYSIVWQETFLSGIEIAFHRPRYSAKVVGLWPRYKQPNRLWEKADSFEGGSAPNRQTGTLMDVPIPIIDSYPELIRDSNYHPAARGLVADGVTPLVIRLNLPAGHYRLQVQAGEGEAGGVPDHIGFSRLHRYLHARDSFPADWIQQGQANDFTVEKTFPNLPPLETIFLIKGFFWQQAGWPLDNPPDVPVEINLWRRGDNGEWPALAADNRFASIPFAIGRPPVMLVHGFNNKSEGWAKAFKDPLFTAIGEDRVALIEYGQDPMAVGPLADYIAYLRETYPEAAATVDDLSMLKNEYDTRKGQYDDLITVLKSLSIIGGGGDDDDDDGSIVDTALSLAKFATYWQKSANAQADLPTLANEVSLRIYAAEEIIRHTHGWAFTRSNAVGHCQGGVLLRMLCTNSENAKPSVSFLHERNFYRGRFNRIVTIGSPHRGCVLTTYFGLYKERLLTEVTNFVGIPKSDFIARITGAMALMFYADRQGYLEPKFDAMTGEVTQLHQTHPVHPRAYFHFISTVINHDAFGPQALFGAAGLVKDSPGSGGLFETLYPLTPKARDDLPFDKVPQRYTDGLIEWRSHFAGVDYTHADNMKYLTNLDVLPVTDQNKVAAHIPPIPVTALVGEPPGPATPFDLISVIKEGVTGDWKSLVKRMATGLLQKWAKSSGASFSLFGTDNTQTSMKILGDRIVDLLNQPIDSHFRSFVDYVPGSGPAGDGDPEGWGSLANQHIDISQAVTDKIRFLFNNGIVGIRVNNQRSAPEPGVYQYELVLSPDWPLVGTPIWSAYAVNGLACSAADITVEPDPGNPLTVTVTVSPDVYGNVILNCSYWTTGDALVQVEPVVIARMNMAAVTGIHFAQFVPLLRKGQTGFLNLEAEFADGFFGPLIPEPGVSLTLVSSDPAVLAVDANGLLTPLATGRATITATYGTHVAQADIRVTGIAPAVVMTQPRGTVYLNGGDSLDLAALATDEDGTIANLSFFADDTHIGSSADIASPYTYTWPDLKPGSYEVYAVAVDNEDYVAVSESRIVEVANRPPAIDAWTAPVADQWYGGNVFLAVEASDPDGDPVTVQFEYSLDSTDGSNGSWAQCYYPLTAAPFDCNWSSQPEDAIDDQVWLRVWAVDAAGEQSEMMTRRIKIDNSTAGMTFSPHPGETGVALDVHPTITFDNPVVKADGSAIDDGDLPTLIGFARQGAPVPFTATINPGKTVVTLVPAALLDGVVPYTVSLLGEVKDSVTDGLFRRTDATFVTTYGAPVALEFRNLVFAGEAGAVLDTPVLVNIVDAQRNTVADSTATINLSLEARAELSGTLAVAAVNGIARFSDLSMTTAGIHRLVATASGLSGTTSPDLVIRPTALARLTVVPSTETLTAGERFSAAVSAFDRFDNPKTDYLGTPNFRSNDPRASLPPAYTFYETDRGVHTYRNTLIFRTRGTRTVEVWDGRTTSPAAAVEVANAPPLAPVPLKPENGGFAGLAPWLTIGPFADVDDALHAGTHVQVSTDAEFAEIIWDSGDLAATLSVQLPAGVLAEFTRYHWRTRVKDSSGDPASEWSPWSAPASFTTGYSLPFVDPFAGNRGWQGLAPGKWTIGPALAGGGQNGYPGPGEDASGSLDNGILGYNIGGDYLPDADAYVTSPPVDCSEAEIVELSFQRWLGVEGVPWGRASILVSTDGRQWQQVWANPDTDVEDSQWHPLTYDITPWAAGQPTVFVRFRMGPMNVADPFCGWHVDDFELRAGEEKLAHILLEISETDIEVGDYFHLNVYVREDHPDANGIMGAAVDIDFPETFVTYRGPTNVLNTVPNPPWDLFRRGTRLSDVIRELGGLTAQTGHGNGVPTLLASIRFSAERAGLARFEVMPAVGFGLAAPVGQIGPWRVQAASLELPIAPASLAPLVLLRLEGPDKPVALGNSFEIKVYVKETSGPASGVLGGPFDLYFDPLRVSAPGFDPATAIQPPYTDIGLVNGTLLENRLDELGGATLQTGHGNGVDKLYAVLAFQADDLGQAVFKAEPGSAGFALTTPVGQVDISRIDYGAPFMVDIRQNFHLTVANGVYATGNGNYVEGDMVAVAADPPATGMAFSHWTGDVAHLADAHAANTTVDMPAADIGIAANYVAVDYTLTVNQGSGSTATAHYQDVLAIQADPPTIGKVFDRWEGDVDQLDDPLAESATVTMPAANVTVTAIYRNILYTLAVENGSGSTDSAIYQQQIAIAANPAPMGYAFSQWTGDVDFLTNAYAVNTTVAMPAGNVAVVAVYVAIDYTLTVNQGSGSTATANYQDVIPIAADTPAIGQAFAGWTGDVAHLADPKAAETTVAMPAAHVSVTATYAMIPYTLLVVNGGGSGVYHYGDVVGIVADEPPPGEPPFSGWVGHADYLAEATAPATTVTMPAGHVAVVAIYGITHSGAPVEIVLGKGWNCFSVPYPTLCPSGQPEFAGLINGPVWRWDGSHLVAVGGGGGRAEKITLDPMYGYWVFSPDGGLMVLPVPEP